MRLIPYLLIGSLLPLAVGTAVAEEDLYSGVLADESRVIGVRFHVGESLDKATLGEHLILSEGNAVRWLKHESRPRPDVPVSFLELHGGDRLPFEVLDTASEPHEATLKHPPHLVATPKQPQNSGSLTEPRQVRVLVRQIKRIVWQSHGSHLYQPGTLFLRSGQQVAFRAAKFSQGMALVLTDEAPRRIALGNIAEMHMPRVSPWQTYYERLAALSPDLSAPLMQWDLADGTRLTTSPLRSRSRKQWASPDEQDWVYDIQPAWALDPVQVRGVELYSLQVFPPHEVPLSTIDPLVIRQKSTFSVGWRPCANSNVRGEVLTSGGQDFLSGFGVPTYSELHFELPSCVQAVRSRLGLDMAAGNGGCARGAIHVNDVQSKPLFVSRRLIGSSELVDTGWLTLHGPRRDQKHLILVADPASKNLPEGADAFDIRDFVDWLEPRLQLDRDKLQKEVRAHLFYTLPGGQQWTASSDDLSLIRLSNYWENTAARAGHFQIQMQPEGTFATLSRNLQLGENDQWLKLHVSRRASATGRAADSPARLQVRFDGQAVAELEVPERLGHGDPEPLLVSVRQFGGRSVEVEMVLMPGKQPGWIHWGAMQTGDFPAPLREIFSEDSVVVDPEAAQPLLQVEKEEAYSGKHSLRVAASTSLQSLGQVSAAIRKHPRPGEFRYLRFAWRKQGGSQLELDLAFQPPQDPAAPAFPGMLHHRYQVRTSRSLPSGTTTTQVGEQLPETWTVVTRDLYEDLGTVQLRSISLSCPDGDYALADHIFLARSLEDFSDCPSAGSSQQVETEEHPVSEGSAPRPKQ